MRAKAAWEMSRPSMDQDHPSYKEGWVNTPFSSLSAVDFMLPQGASWSINDQILIQIFISKHLITVKQEICHDLKLEQNQLFTVE